LHAAGRPARDDDCWRSITVPFAATSSLPISAIRFQSCVDDRETGTLCDRVYDWTGVDWLAESADWILAKPAAITVILVLAFLIRFLLHRVIRRLAHRAAEGTVPGVLAKGKGSRLLEVSPLLSERRKQRADTMSSVLRSVTTGAIFSVALLMILDVIGLPIGPLLASAGILGVAIGFGAQTLVKDFLSGIFMILEDQYGVGDVVDLGEASGVVEAVGLRVTRLRDVNGTVWYVRNGEILRVGNQSQGWARAVIDVGVAYNENIPRVKELLSEAAHTLMEDEAFKDLVLEEPEVWGVESLAADGVVVRVVIKTVPLQQWTVARELRQRIKATFDAHNVEIPFPQRAVWVRTAGPGAEQGAPSDEELAKA
jgi:small conductance mechanosensitive channel